MSTHYRWDDFHLDLDAYRLSRAGVPLALEPKAFNLLVLLVRRPGHLYTKQEIFDAVWANTVVTDHALTRVVAQLRRVIGDEAREARFLETVPTRGYRWVCPVVCDEVAAEPPARILASDATGHASADAAVAEPRPIVLAAPTLPRRSHTYLPAAFVVVAVVALAMWRTDRAVSTGGSTGAGRTSHGVARPVQLTTHPGLDTDPSFAPLGDAVTFASDRTGSFEIYVRSLGGDSTETAVTHDRGENVEPAWSPDGRFIAYHSYRLGGVWVVPARGGTPRQVVAAGSRPAWSPDSRRLAFQTDDHPDVSPIGFGAQSGSVIGVTGIDGSGVTMVTHSGRPAGGHAAPSWSPDGRRLVFTVFEAGPESGVWCVDLVSRAAKPIALRHQYTQAIFSRAGTSIYSSTGEAFIVRIPFDPVAGTARGEPEMIPVPGVLGVRGMSVSPDGTRIGFGSVTLSSQIWTEMIDRDGNGVGPPRALTADTSFRNSVPAVSPDGARVAYASARTGEAPNIWVVDIDGAGATQLTSADTAEQTPSWFPDGRSVAFLRDGTDGLGIWSIDLSTRREELLFDTSRPSAAVPGVPAAGRLAEFQLAPSVHRGAFTLFTPPDGRRQLFVAGLPATTMKSVTEPGLSVGYPSWSPDERRLAVEIHDHGSTQAGVIDVATGALRWLTHERGEVWVRSWSPDGRRVAAAVMRDGRWGLTWIDADTGATGTMLTPQPPSVYVRYPAWSPRGDLVVFERGEMRGNIWTLRLN